MKINKEQCSEKVWDSTSWYSYPCSKKAIIEREEKMWCKIHDPEYKKEKKAKQEEKYEELKCKKCWYYFDKSTRYSFCPYCGTKKLLF